MTRSTLKTAHLKARMFRAVSGLTQEQMGEATGITPSLLDQFEQGHVVPGSHHLAVMAGCAGVEEAEVDELLRQRETQGSPWLRSSRGAAGTIDRLVRGLRRHCASAVRRLLKVRPPVWPPEPWDCRMAEEQLASLKRLSRRSQLAAVRSIEELQNWALVERCCDESVRQASHSLKRATAWARLAMEIARLVSGPKSWLDRLGAYALAHWANVLRVQGRLQAAEARLDEAKRLWQAGSDPRGLLDPGKLLDLEGSLRRDQRRFAEALFLFDQALPISRFPERVLLMKGFTYDVMGEHALAIATYLEAAPLVERRGDARLKGLLRLNLASNMAHARRYGEAAELIAEARRSPEGLGKIDRSRIPWLEGRILAGLGRPAEALTALAEARRRFAAEAMSYDVALALMEEAGLLLGEGRTEEVKALTLDLAKVFESKGVHPEAEAALRLFQEAVQQETATAELARGVLGFLFQARHDQSLRFGPSGYGSAG